MSFITPDLKIESMQVFICAVWLTDQVDSSKLLLLLLACSCCASVSVLTYYRDCDFAKYLDQNPFGGPRTTVKPSPKNPTHNLNTTNQLTAALTASPQQNTILFMVIQVVLLHGFCDSALSFAVSAVSNLSAVTTNESDVLVTFVPNNMRQSLENTCICQNYIIFLASTVQVTCQITGPQTLFSDWRTHL